MATWPTLETACCCAISAGRFSMLRTFSPKPIAPEDTSTISLPFPTKLEMTKASWSIFAKLILPFGNTKELVPILMTMRFTASKSRFIILLCFLFL